MMKRGLLLINLGTPKSADFFDVRNFLREFLIDQRVIDLPFPLRYLLIYCLILPFKSQKSAKAYQQIWTKDGSPLLVHSQLLKKRLQDLVHEKYQVSLGMRYGKPSIREALSALKDCHSISILPLYPQYSSAATGSAIAAVMRSLKGLEIIPSISIINNFYQHSAYIRTLALKIKSDHQPSNFLLFSYHGLPKRQLLKTCKKICPEICPINLNDNCYSSQCHQTSNLLARELNLSLDQYSTSFQSRLGKTVWLQPYTDNELIRLAAKGIKNLSICCPSFVADCLETLEEIGIRAKEKWMSLGGEQFTLIPSLNDDPLWAQAIIEITESV